MITGKTEVLLIICLLMVISVRAQEVVVSANLDPYDSVLIGDYVTLEISAETNEETHTIWPQTIDTLTNFDILNASSIDTIIEEGKVKIKQDITLAAYDSGVFIVAAIPFYFIAQNGDTQKLNTTALALRVNTLDVDTALPFKAIKPPIGVKYTLAELWPWLLITTLALGLILLSIYLMRKRAAEESIPASSVQMPPNMVANKKLDLLEAKKLWQRGHIKEYYVELSEVVREYIESRFGILALESTTDEIIHDLGNSRYHAYDSSKLQDLLTISDFVKFAKVVPMADENSMNIRIAREYIKNTQPVIVEPKKEVADA